MQQILLGLQVLIGVAIIGLVLIQQGRGADAGASFGGGSSGSMFGSRGPASFLAKLTGGMAALFFLNSIGLAYLAGDAVRSQSVVERAVSAPDTAVPAAPSDVPTAPGSEVTDSVPAAPDAGGGGAPGSEGGSDSTR